MNHSIDRINLLKYYKGTMMAGKWDICKNKVDPKKVIFPWSWI